MSSSLAGDLHLRYDALELSQAALLLHVAAFSREYPAISLSLLPARRDALETELIAGHIHAALALDIASEPFLNTRQVGTLHYIAVAAPGYLASRDLPQSVADVLALQLIDTAVAAPLQSSWLAKARGEHDVIAPKLVVADHAAALAAALVGMGVAFVPGAAAGAGLAAGALVRLLPEHEGGAHAVHFAYRKKNSRPLVESVFLEFMLERLAAEK